MSDKYLDNVRFVTINSIHTLEEQLTPKLYVDQTISDGVDESSLLRIDPDKNLKFDEQDSKVLNSTLLLPKTIIKLPTKSLYVGNKLNDPSIIRNTAHVALNDKNLDNASFVKVNSLPAVREHLTPNFYVDEAFCYWLDELSLLRLDPNEYLKLDEQDSIILNSTLTSPKTIIELPTKSYVDSSQEINKIRRDLSLVFNDQGNEFDINKITILDSVTINRNPTLDNEVSDRKICRRLNR